jgi:DNA polymerase-4
VTTPRTIIHIDMNAFFASVEQQSNPALRGKPIAVIGAAARTVITTASYEARAFGVKTGMTVYEGRRACPELILVTGNNRKYTHTSAGIIAILREFTPLVEVFSIDEAFLDITGSLRLFGSAERIAYLIKAKIRHAFGLTCSIGIAPNKLLAKLASEMQKPDGLTVIPPDEVGRILDTVPIKELCGIGRQTERVLTSFGIRTCGDLGRFPVAILRKRFGIVGERLHFMGLGVDDAPVVPEEEAAEVKSVGHSTTLPHDLSDPDAIRRQLLQLSEMVGRRARRYGVAGKTVTLTIRYADFTTFSRQASAGQYISESAAIYAAAAAILDGLDLLQPVRLLGVRITNLRYHGAQLPLFVEERKRALAVAAMDGVNNRYGDFTVTYGTILDDDKGAAVISPAWRPDGIRCVDVS